MSGSQTFACTAVLPGELVKNKVARPLFSSVPESL